MVGVLRGGNWVWLGAALLAAAIIAAVALPRWQLRRLPLPRGIRQINPTSDFSYVLKPRQIADGAALACQTRLKTNVVLRLAK